MMVETDISGPWYRHSWPWFVVILLSTTVAAGIATVWIAFDAADSLVVDDYFRDGKSINRSLAADREARLREAVALVVLGDSVSVSLDLLGEFPLALELQLSHVTRSERDQSFELLRDSEGRYTSDARPLEGRFYITLRPAGPKPGWRLRGRATLPAMAGIRLEPAE